MLRKYRRTSDCEYLLLCINSPCVFVLPKWFRGILVKCDCPFLCTHHVHSQSYMGLCIPQNGYCKLLQRYRCIHLTWIIWKPHLSPSKALGTEKINHFMRTIYQHDVFLPSATGAELANDLYVYVRAYMFEAFAASREGSSYFPLHPKLHALHEIGHELLRQSKVASFCLNPVAHVCSMDEDFIGRTATLSRQVSPRLVSRRTLERYLCHLQILWARGRWKLQGEKMEKGGWLILR